MGTTTLISERGKRKLEYQGTFYYWYIKKDFGGVPKIHIISDDKKLYLIYAFDRERVISPMYIQDILNIHFAK